MHGRHIDALRGWSSTGKKLASVEAWLRLEKPEHTRQRSSNWSGDGPAFHPRHAGVTLDSGEAADIYSGQEQFQFRSDAGGNWLNSL